MSLRRAILAATGIAAGVMALIVVLGVMGGLQKGYIDSILEISSFHLRVEVPESFIGRSLDSLRSISGVESAVAFKETHVLAMGPSGKALTLNLRAFQDGSSRFDPSLVKALGLSSRDELPQKGRLILGKEAATALGASEGTSIELFGMSKSADEGILPLKRFIPLGATFNSGYYEFDSSMGFISLESSDGMEGLFSSSRPTIGIKLKNRYDDYRIAKEIQSMLPPDASAVLSWREFNRSFFGALRTEKTIMMILISLIFVVVGINIFHAMRRTIAAKMSDIAVLKACGASNADIRSIFVIDGIFIGVSGALTGSALGLLLIANINSILDAAAFLLRSFYSLLATVGLSSPKGDFRLFSPAYFYIEAIPVSISFA
ncbi:MAG: FtsX-like permease family protein, partial [Spirochaetales bacterium]